MKVFHCDHCEQLLFFENSQCVTCGHTLAYLPDLKVVGSLDPAGDNLWKTPIPRSEGQLYRLCDNYTKHAVCNWAVPADQPDLLCFCCRLTTVIPSLDVPAHSEGWHKLEVAKRRLVYGLLELGCPVVSKAEDPASGLAFEFLADPPEGEGAPFLTGHANGLITVNLAEADDVERERRRQLMHEPYRTLLGHFRHEVGHYYWERLIQDSERIEEFRKLFGDEREDYSAALQSYYTQGAPPDWQTRCVSAYATAHAWEDWAESWAHYMHMADALETAADCGLRLRPQRADEPQLTAVVPKEGLRNAAFDRLIDNWYPLTFLLNNLNRGMGLSDGYPFVLSPPAVEKLRFIHESIPLAAEADAPASQGTSAKMPTAS